MAIYSDIFDRPSVGGRYKVLKRLGGGAFGEVFLADQEVAGIPGVKFRQVALKLFTQDYVNAANAEEVFAEAILIEGLAHGARSRGEPVHLVTTYDIGVLRDYSGVPYVAMECVHGTLKGQLDKSSLGLPLDAVIRHMRGICAGVRLAHEHSPASIHRDLKPENVLIEKNGFLKVADFGLAIDRHTAFTRTGQAGTICYAPPESRLGRIATPAFDVYSLGVIMLELLSKWNPIAKELEGVGEDRALVNEVLERAQSALAELNDPSDGCPIASRFTELRQAPFALEVIRRCLAMDPSGRYPNVMELDRALADLEAGREPEAAPALPKVETGRERLERLLIETAPLLKADRLADAAARLKEISQLSPQDERYQFLLADLREKEGDFAAAIRAQKEGNRIMAKRLGGGKPSREMAIRLVELYKAGGKPAAAEQMEQELRR
jgi:eukaryotic-like serine/threonine-protein kinase